MAEDRDDITGMALDPKKVREGVAEEMSYMHKHDVWTPVPRQQVLTWNPGAKIIRTRWVKTVKGNLVRCRLVAMEFATEKRDDLFAGTPPLLSMRHLISSAMSCGEDSFNQAISVVDVKRAFLHGKVDREIYIEIPKEDSRSQGGVMIGRLNRALYGTRDAPMAWQKVVQDFMVKHGFQPCLESPGVYYEENRGLKIISHVDDFLVVGPRSEVQWFNARLASEYEVKVQMMGWRSGDRDDVSFLGRTIRKVRGELRYKSIGNIARSSSKSGGWRMRDLSRHPW